ncbi:hypothetical protein [Cohnella silvisoli]|uniref:Uncharacterized protein n=1 Tax=Cohnella silvisoli TaxID=2873699 RepID=A0ABV1KTR6_9BACL|nr:hypothetical protein [Cohnella silvisoli]MCD9022773.1 hypothetical protein [Cohnella silvisoli]
MIPKKMDSNTVRELRKILNKANITNPRVTIDFNKEIVELEETDEYAVDDLLQSVGVLPPNRVKELREEVGQMREEWDS